jgi:hypothetical protein
MNEFIGALVSRLKTISTQNDVRSLYDWLWENQSAIATTASQINKSLGLQDPYDLQSDLPCLTIGSLSGLLLLSANPGWKPDRNIKENSYCQRSCEAYADMMFNFFNTYPREIGQRGRWWTQPMSFISMLRGQEEIHEKLGSGARRWQFIHESRQLGGWELFPWHSKKDGLTGRVNDFPWLREFFVESIRTAIRIQPQMLMVASKVGWHLIRNEIPELDGWHDFRLGSKIPVQASYLQTVSGTEIVALNRQIFSAPRDFLNQELFQKIRDRRAI